MDLFNRLIREGWWKNEPSFDPLKDVTEQNWEKLFTERSTVVANSKGERFVISIPAKKPLNEIKGGDIQIFLFRTD